MKLEDVKVGQILKDKYGNKYEVKLISKDDLQSVFVSCVEFKKKVYVSEFDITKCGDSVWLIDDKNILLSKDSLFGRAICQKLKFTYFSSCFNKITISSGFDSQTFLLCKQSTIDKILTLSDLEEDVVIDYLTADNVKLGMKVIDGIGNEYVVDDIVDDSVSLLLNMKTTNIDGESCVISLKTWIPFYDEKDVITTKDFLIVQKEQAK